MTISLIASTGNVAVDHILSEVISHFEGAFAGQVCGYYVEGSYADGTGIATSDVDLTIVFKGTLEGDERVRAARLAQDCTVHSRVELDIDLIDDATLRGGRHPHVQAR